MRTALNALNFGAGLLAGGGLVWAYTHGTLAALTLLDGITALAVGSALVVTVGVWWRALELTASDRKH